MKRHLELWGGPECTINRVRDTYQDQFERCGHYDRIDDLNLFADIGITTIRYPILWECIAPDRPGQHLWQGVDARIDRLRAHGIDVIAGHLSKRTQAWIDVLGFVFFMLPVTVLILNFALPYAMESIRNQEVSSNAGGLIVWPAPAAPAPPSGCGRRVRAAPASSGRCRFRSRPGGRASAPAGAPGRPPRLRPPAAGSAPPPRRSPGAPASGR